MTYTSEDGTMYRLEKGRLQNYVTVVDSPYPDVKKAYTLVTKGLKKCYQPIDFSIEDGIVLHSATVEGYIKSISQEDDKITLGIFGSEAKINIPFSSTSLPRNSEVLLAPAIETADMTNHFLPKNSMMIGDKEVKAILQKDEPFIIIPSNFRFKGNLTAYSDGFIEIKYKNTYRVFSLYDKDLNRAINKLPEEVSLTLVDDTIYLIDISIASDPQDFIVDEVFLLADNILKFRLSTLDNKELTFDLTFIFDGNKHYSLLLNKSLLNTFEGRPLDTYLEE